MKSNKNNYLRTNINSLCENKNPQKSSKTSNFKKNKLIKYQSVLFPKNKSLFDPKNNLRPKCNSNAISKKENDKIDDNKDSDINSLKIAKKDKKDNNIFEQRKASNQNNIQVYKNNFNKSFESWL